MQGLLIRMIVIKKVVVATLLVSLSLAALWGVLTQQVWQGLLMPWERQIGACLLVWLDAPWILVQRLCGDCRCDVELCAFGLCGGVGHMD